MIAVFVGRATMRTSTMKRRRLALDGAALLVALVLAMAFSSGSNVGAEPLIVAEFAIPDDGDLIMVPVQFRGQRHLFVVDTGTTGVMYDATLRNALGKPVGRMKTRSLSRPTALDLFPAPAGFLGPLDLRGRDATRAAPVACVDLGGLNAARAGDENVRGIIGCSFLRQHIFRLDVEHGKLSFLRELGPDPGVRVPVEFAHGVPAIRAELPGIGESVFEIDTGCVGPSVSLSIATADRLEKAHFLTRIGVSETVDFASRRRRELQLSRIPSLTVGAFRQTDVVCGEHVEGESCIMGLAYLSRYVVTFDIAGGAIYLKPNNHFAAPDSSNLRGGERCGISVARRNGAVVAAGVFPQSPAEKAGVRTGDVILSVDGKNVAGLRLFAVDKLFLSRPERTKLIVRRGDRELDLTLRLPPLASLDGGPKEPWISKWGSIGKWSEKSELEKSEVELFPDHSQAQRRAREAPDKKHGSVQVLESFDIPTDGYPLLVPVTIGGKTYRFMIATGTTSNVFDRKLRPLLGAAGGIKNAPIEVARREQAIYEAPEARLGRLLVRRPPPHPTAKTACYDLSVFRLVTGDDVQGVLGYPFLQDYVVRLDFDSGKLLFLSALDADPGEPVPFTIELGTPTVRANFGSGLEAPFHVASGRCGESGTLGHELISELERRGWLSVSKRIITAGQADGDPPEWMEVGSFGLSRFRHAKLLFSNGAKSLHNWLALRYLTRYIVTFDFPNHMMYLKPSRNYARPESEPPRGTPAWGVVLSCLTGEVCVLQVHQRSPAALAGVEVSDVLVAVDGTQVGAPRDFSIHKLFCTSADTLRLTVRRRGRTQELTLKYPVKAGGS